MRIIPFIRITFYALASAPGAFIGVMWGFSDHCASIDWTRPDGSTWSIGTCYGAVKAYNSTIVAGWFTDTDVSVNIEKVAHNSDYCVPFDYGGRQAAVSALGVKYFSYHFDTTQPGWPWVQGRTRAIVVPDWLIVPLLLVLPVIALRREMRRTWRRRRGCCSSCGYDLRASIGRCPECGGIRETQPAGRADLSGSTTHN